jgi:hypothetical protein
VRILRRRDRHHHALTSCRRWPKSGWWSGTRGGGLPRMTDVGDRRGRPLTGWRAVRDRSRCSRYININVASTHHISLNPSSSWKKILHVSGMYHSTSTGGYQLSIAHLVDKHKYFYNKDDIRKGTTIQPIIIIQEPYT